MEYYLALKKEWNLAICNNMGGAREYNVKHKKSVRERQKPYNFTHIWNLRTTQMNKREKRERDKPRNRLFNCKEQTDFWLRVNRWGGMDELGKKD